MTSDINKTEFSDETKLKLDIFRECFREWFPVFIHHQHIKRLLVYDMFAGSGQDIKGTPGSPLILLQEAKSHCKFLSKNRQLQVYFGFNELKQDKEQELEHNVQEYMSKCQSICGFSSCPYQEHIRFKCADFKDIINDPKILGLCNDKCNAKFVLMDQYGFKQINDDIFTKLISFPKTDFIFFIASSFVKRFRELSAVTNYFKKAAIRYDESQPKECHRNIANYFRSLIPANKEYYLHSFTIHKNKNYYGLIFGTSHTLGMEKFLKVCWKYDNLAGESNCNIENDYAPDGLFHDPLNTNKKNRISKKIRDHILSGSITNNIDGLRFALSEGCEPSLFVTVISDMKKKKEVDIDGKFNKQATNIHKAEKYSLKCPPQK